MNRFLLHLGVVASLFSCESQVTRVVVSEPEPDSRLSNTFVLSVMQECKATLSEAKADILTAQIIRISNRFFKTREEKEAFVFLICIESKFQDSAKSSVGAVGLTQVMPQFAPGFAKSCGLGQLKPADLIDSEVNLTIGGCWFASLIKYHNSIVLALAAYNSGRDSESVKRLQSLGAINLETANYVAKYANLRGKFADATVSSSNHQ